MKRREASKALALGLGGAMLRSVAVAVPGIGLEKMTILELPGSGTRLSALLSGKIDAGSLHFDQVESIMGKGNFKILIEPWKEFAGWTNWEKLRTKIRAWPDDGNFSVAAIQAMLPAYH